MKIVYVHHATYFGGSSKSLALAIKELIKLGVEPHIICPRGTVVEYFQEFTKNVYPISHRSFPLTMTIVNNTNEYYHFVRNLRNRLYVRRVQKVIDEISPDLVHCNDWGLVDVAKNAKRKGYPVVMHARTMPEPSYPIINNYAVRRIKKYCDQLICISGSVHNAFSSIDKKTIIYNPLEISGNLERHDKPSSPVKVVSLSAIQKNKGVFDILDSAKELIHREDIKFIIAGKINKVDYQSLSFLGKLKYKVGLFNLDANKFLEQIEKDNIGNIKLLGHVSDIFDVLKDADILIAPMHLNAPPRSVFEAGIYGIPSVLSMRDIVEDIIENHKTGIIIQEKRSDLLSAAILDLVDNKTKRLEMGRKAKERFTINHSCELIGKQILGVYQRILQKN